MLDDNCLFCKIIEGVIPSTKVYEDEYCYAFNDINPQTPVHVIVVPKTHIASVLEIDDSNSLYVAKCFEAVKKIADSLGLEGFRVINNCGEDGGQTVMHLHFHILGGKKLSDKII